MLFKLKASIIFARLYLFNIVKWRYWWWIIFLKLSGNSISCVMHFFPFSVFGNTALVGAHSKFFNNHNNHFYKLKNLASIGVLFALHVHASEELSVKEIPRNSKLLGLHTYWRITLIRHPKDFRIVVIVYSDDHTSLFTPFIASPRSLICATRRESFEFGR